MATNPDLYSALDRKAKGAADEWFTRMGPAFEEAAEEWCSDHPDVERDVYFKIVHPVLLWRFYYHASEIFLNAGLGWQQVYIDNVKEG